MGSTPDRTPPPEPSGTPAPVDFARLLGAMPIGVLHAAGERIDYVNPVLLAMLRETEQSLLGRPFWEIIGPDDGEVTRERYWARQQGARSVPASYEVSLRRSDGSLVRTEIEPRALGDRELLVLIRDVSRRVRDSALLAALSQVALEVQRARDAAGVLAAAGQGLRGYGISMLALRLCGAEAVVEHADGPEETLQLFRRIIDQPLAGLRLTLEEFGLTPRALANLCSHYEDALLGPLSTALKLLRPRLDPSQLESALLKARMTTGVLCPLIVHGELWGLLWFAADALASADAAALGLFASKVAQALENATTICDLERRNRELAAIHAVATAGSEADLDRLLPQLLRLAVEATGSDGSAIYLLDPDHAVLKLAGQHGGKGLIARRLRYLPLERGPGQPADHMLETRAISVRDLLPETQRDFAVEGFLQLASVPLIIKGRFAGQLWLSRRADEPYTEDELRSVERISSQVAIQVESARLYADANRRVRLLSVLFDLSQIATEAIEVAPLVDRVLDKLCEAIAADAALIHLYDDGRLVLAGSRTPGGRSPLAGAAVAADADPVCGKAALERRTQVREVDHWPVLGDEATPRHAAAVPLISKDRVIGTFSLVRHIARPFDDEEVRLLESSAAQVAVAIEHARLFEDERRRVGELKLLLEVGRLITASLDLEQILEASAAGMARMAEATDAFICLLDERRQTLLGVATSAVEHREHFKTVRIALDEAPVIAEALYTRAPVRVSDAVGALGQSHWLLERYRQKSILALPLQVRDEPIGAVVISDTGRQRGWTDDQVERATIVARQVSVAVANARLFRDLKASYDKLADAQEQLVKRERLAALGELSAVVAHEVRNPLGVIFNSLVTLRRMLKPQGDAAMLLDIVEEEADRLNRIVGDLLDFARPNEPSMQAEPLEELLSRAVESATPLAAASNVGMELRFEGPLPAVPADARMLRQAILNLVMNGIQAMSRGGRLVLRAGEEQLDGRGWAFVEVSDTGPGISPDIAGRIFQPFFTTKASGTGLGLAVVKRIVDAHGGRIELRSEPGRGASFRIWLPAAESAAPGAAGRKAGEGGAGAP